MSPRPYGAAGAFLMPKELKVLPTEDEIWAKWIKEGSEKKAALLLDIPLEQVRAVVEARGESARANVVGARFADLTLAAIEKAGEVFWKLEPWRKVNAARDLVQAYRRFIGVSEGKGSTNIGQIFIGADRAESLKRTMESVEGEVIDDSNA